MSKKEETLLMFTNHKHPLYPRSYVTLCGGCGQGSTSCDALYCPDCDIGFHKKCIESAPEIQYSFHPRHPLKLLIDGLHKTEDDKCLMCSKKVFQLLVYHCSKCNYNVDLDCVQNPPLLATDLPNTHQHILFIMPRKVVFTCDACGINGDRSPYVCPQCDFMIHNHCLDLPRVIRINRHEHRISHTFFRGYDVNKCGVCRKMIDGKYGAYSCSKCYHYSVHSKCATRKDVWDGIELKDISEENDKGDNILMAYKIINNQEINHFCHEKHNLRFTSHKISHDKNMCCQGCALPVYLNSFYKCIECDDFILHETCAKLPRRKQHVLHNHQLILHAEFDEFFRCSACDRFSSGFSYQCCDIKLDIRCASISEPFFSKVHGYSLYYTSEEKNICKGCGDESTLVLNCTVCEFAHDFKCATLPYTMMYEYDDHPLSLLTVNGGTGWCEICEKRMDLNTLFYSCKICDSTFHTNCLLGDFKYLKEGSIYAYGKSDLKIKVVQNNHMTRVYCASCGSPCNGKCLSLIGEESIAYAYACSSKCFNDLCKSV